MSCGRVRSSTLSTMKPLRPDDPAPADVEDLDRRLELVLDQADDVDVLGPVGHHLLALDGLAHAGEPVAQSGGPLELELGGGVAASPTRDGGRPCPVSPSRKSISSSTRAS